MNIVIVIALVIAGAAAIWFFIGNRVRADMDKEISKAADAIPGVTREEAIAKAAAEAAKLELKAAQEAEEQALVEEQASIVRQLEGRLRDLETAAIIQPLDPAIIKETEEVEARAVAERAELELRWRDALNRAEVAMVRAEEAAIVATDAHKVALEKIAYWENLLARLPSKIERAKATLAGADPFSLKIIWTIGSGITSIGLDYVKLRAMIAIWEKDLERYKRNAEVARTRATAVKVEAASAISSANLTIERVLTIIADLRLLGILLALASRVDGIAKATRMKLAELEARLAQ